MDATLLAITVLLYRVSYGEAAIAAVDADAIIKTAISRHNMLFLLLNIVLFSFQLIVS